jgi:hypothetical protein
MPRSVALAPPASVHRSQLESRARDRGDVSKPLRGLEDPLTVPHRRRRAGKNWGGSGPRAEQTNRQVALTFLIDAMFYRGFLGLTLTQISLEEFRRSSSTFTRPCRNFCVHWAQWRDRIQRQVERRTPD